MATLGWFSISSPPIPQPAPARLATPEPPDDAFPPEPPLSGPCWLRYRASDLSHVSGWRWVRFESHGAREGWVAIWGADFEVVWSETSPSSDSQPLVLPS